MGDIAILEPVADTLSFVDAAKRKADYLMLAMIAAKDCMMCVENIAELDRHHDLFLSYQRAMQRANGVLEFIAGTMEDAHSQRSSLWNLLPANQDMVLVATKTGVSNALVMQVKRQTAAILCSDFVLIELNAERRPAA